MQVLPLSVLLCFTAPNWMLAGKLYALTALSERLAYRKVVKVDWHDRN